MPILLAFGDPNPVETAGSSMEVPDGATRKFYHWRDFNPEPHRLDVWCSLSIEPQGQGLQAGIVKWQLVGMLKKARLQVSGPHENQRLRNH